MCHDFDTRGPPLYLVSGVVTVAGVPTPSIILNTKKGRFVPRFRTKGFSLDQFFWRLAV
jgi:hypothetical protein